MCLLKYLHLLREGKRNSSERQPECYYALTTFVPNDVVRNYV